MPGDIDGGMADDSHAHLHIAVHGVRGQVRGRDERITPVGYQYFRVQLQVLINRRKTPGEDLRQRHPDGPSRDQDAPVVSAVWPDALVDHHAHGQAPGHGFSERHHDLLDDALAIVSSSDPIPDYEQLCLRSAEDLSYDLSGGT